MSELTELTFCESCIFSEEKIRTPDGLKACAYKTLNETRAVAWIAAMLDQENGGSRSPGAVAEAMTMRTGADYYLGIISCIKSVQAGGPPVLVY